MPNLDANEEKLIKLLIFIDLAGEIAGKTKLQKLVFLGDREFKLNSGFNFEKYNYGPYSFELSEYLSALKTLNLISVDTEFFDTDDTFIGKKITYKITEEGKTLAEKRVSDFPDFINSSKEVISKWANKPLDTIIEYVYANYMK